MLEVIYSEPILLFGAIITLFFVLRAILGLFYMIYCCIRYFISGISLGYSMEEKYGMSKEEIGVKATWKDMKQLSREEEIKIYWSYMEKKYGMSMDELAARAYFMGVEDSRIRNKRGATPPTLPVGTPDEIGPGKLLELSNMARKY